MDIIQADASRANANVVAAPGAARSGRSSGLGITLEEDLVRELRIDDPYRLPNGNYRDEVFGRGQTRYIGDYTPKGGQRAA